MILATLYGRNCQTKIQESSSTSSTDDMVFLQMAKKLYRHDASLSDSELCQSDAC